MLPNAVPPRLVPSMKLAARAAALVVAAIGAMVLCGWTFDVAILRTFLPDRPRMVPNAAVAFLAAGAALWLLVPDRPERRRRLAGRVLAGLVAVIGVVAQVEFVTGRDLAFDALFLTSEHPPPHRVPGRLVFEAAAGLVLVGAGLLLLDVRTRRGRRPAEAASLAAGLMGYLFFTAHLYGAWEIFRVPGVPFAGLGVHTAVSLGLLAVGVLAARPADGLMAILTSDAAGGPVARRLTVAALLMPPLLGLVVAEGLGLDAEVARFALAFLAVTTGTVAMALVLVTAEGLSRADEERRRAEHEVARLVESESQARAWLAAVIDELPDAVLLLSEGGRRVTYNQAARRLARGDAGERDPFGNPILLDLRSPAGEPIPWSEQPCSRALLAREAVIGAEHVLRTAEGGLVPVLTSATPVRGHGGDLAGAVAVFRDITPLKELERLREEWTAVIAHDLRQPVNVITLGCEALPLTHPGELAEKEARTVDRIRTSADRLARMIEDLLDFSRIEAQRLKIVPRELDLAALLCDVIDRAPAETAGHRIQFAGPAGPIPVLADPARVEQVVGNLLSNAAKYGVPGAEIVLAVAPAAGAVEVAVTNRGRGIPPDELPRLFTRFYRTRAAERAAGGLGLGLYIVKGLVEAHGGQVWAESVPGETTTFRFTLPRPGAPAPGR